MKNEKMIKDEIIKLRGIQHNYDNNNKFYSRNIYSLIFNNISDYVYFDGWDGKTGVYMINDFYIGRTSDIIQRATYHILDAIVGYYDGKNILKSKHILDIIYRDDKITIKRLDKKQKEEANYIKEYSNRKEYKLTNIEFNEDNKLPIDYDKYKLSHSYIDKMESIDYDDDGDNYYKEEYGLLEDDIPFQIDYIKDDIVIASKKVGTKTTYKYYTPPSSLTDYFYNNQMDKLTIIINKKKQ